MWCFQYPIQNFPNSLWEIYVFYLQFQHCLHKSPINCTALSDRKNEHTRGTFFCFPCLRHCWQQKKCNALTFSWKSSKMSITLVGAHTFIAIILAFVPSKCVFFTRRNTTAMVLYTYDASVLKFSSFLLSLVPQNNVLILLAPFASMASLFVNLCSSMLSQVTHASVKTPNTHMSSKLSLSCYWLA